MQNDTAANMENSKELTTIVKKKNNENISDLKSYLSSIEWFVLATFVDINDSVEYFFLIFIMSLNKM